MSRSIFGAASILVAAVIVPAVPAWAQQSSDNGSRSAVASRAPAPLVALKAENAADIALDGRLDEAVWLAASPISDFTQQEPTEGAEPSERTEIRVVFDEDNLYIGAIIYDDPDGILAFQRERDAGLGTDDRFMWILDTFLDGRTGYFFEINAAGLMGDGVIASGGRGGRGGGGGGGGGGTNKAWDGIWEARTFVRPDGWSAEIQIPFRTLNFNPNRAEWGINFQRTIRRKNEEVLWRGHLRNQGLRNPVFAGRLTGLSGLSQGLGLEAVPSTVVSWRNIPGNVPTAAEPDLGPNTFPADVSLDLNYSLTSSLRASVSLNTDFAEVESDQRRVNLTRFAIRFPEQRDFFLEGSGVFAFAPNGGPSPFYSRAIGINQGQQVPLNYGSRLTGQAGRFELGFYQIGTGQLTYFDTDDAVDVTIPREDFTVARVKRQFFEQSALGAIYTRRSTARDPAGVAPVDRHTAGVDLDLKTRHFLGDRNLSFSAYLVANTNPLDTENPDYADLSFGELSSWGARVAYPNDVWDGHLSYRDFGDAFDPAVGFVTRNNFRRVNSRVQWSPRVPGVSWLRDTNHQVQLSTQRTIDTGILEEREWQFKLLGLNFESGDELEFNANNRFEYLDEAFEVSDGVAVSPGEYSNWEYQIGGQTARRRRVSVQGSFSRSGFWDGDRNRTEARVTLRPNPGISLSTNFEYNEVDLSSGSFTASLYEVSGDWNPSPWVSLTNQVQYDDQSEVVGLFARLRWIVKPGNDVYLVYSHNWQYTSLLASPNDRELVTLSRGGSVKVNYTYRF
ncbi:MAG: carbohydrate binding family 9 domain-containing protein [Gemmatimonadetes bacterium]|nr:carbohydrate binding family 9 domain-containing protein [Gemmatimonadota bacterium]